MTHQHYCDSDNDACMNELPDQKKTPELVGSWWIQVNRSNDWHLNGIRSCMCKLNKTSMIMSVFDSVLSWSCYKGFNLFVWKKEKNLPTHPEENVRENTHEVNVVCGEFSLPQLGFKLTCLYELKWKKIHLCRAYHEIHDDGCIKSWPDYDVP